MAIETLDDIAEELADQLYMYDACPERGDCENPVKICRSCWISAFKSRVRDAIDIEQRLAKTHPVAVANRTKHPTSEGDAVACELDPTDSALASDFRLDAQTYRDAVAAIDLRLPYSSLSSCDNSPASAGGEHEI